MEESQRATGVRKEDKRICEIREEMLTFDSLLCEKDSDFGAKSQKRDAEESRK